MKDTSRPLSAAYQCYKHELKGDRRRWLVTGGAGFIGSNLVEMLLLHDQDVVILDNLATGHRRNLVEVEEIVGPVRWSRCNFIQGDIRDLNTCRVAVAGVQHVLHQAALGSVSRSLNDPLTSNEVNVSGFLNMLVAARDAHVDSFVYAASSSTYGDHEALPKVEDRIGRPLSPYAATKLVNEIYSDVFGRCYGFRATGLRYFNVFGRRQDPNGAYAAVIPKWTASLLERRPVHINGDGHTSRDFCYVENVVQANILAALTPDEASGQIYNIAGGNRMDLNTLYKSLCAALAGLGFQTSSPLIYQDFRPGDVRHSLADISKAQHMLDYRPSHDVQQGLSEAMPWYVDFLSRQLPELEKA